MQSQMNTLDIPFTFFDAVDALDNNFTNYDRAVPAITQKRKGWKLRDSEVACFSSHYEAWKYCVSINEPVAILEDNVDLDDTAKTAISYGLEQANKFGLVKLSATNSKKFKTLHALDETFSIGQYTSKTCGATAYVLSAEGAHKLVKNAEKFIEPVDDYMEKPWRHSVKVMIVYPPTFHRAAIESTISSRNSKRKIKLGVSAIEKIYIEMFRVYESIMKAFTWDYRK
jgi:glycosyl transferase family 25